MKEIRHATRQDFDNNRHFCVFFIKIDENGIEVEDRGVTAIQEEKKTNTLRLDGVGSFNNTSEKCMHRGLGVMNFQSASDFDWTGYYVDYFENRDFAKVDVLQKAHDHRTKMIEALEKRLTRLMLGRMKFIEK